MNLDYKPAYPKTSALNIGIVGAGEIVQHCHLPAYKMAGFNVTAICDPNIERAQALAKEFGIANVVDNSGALSERDDVDIVDIATPSQVMPGIVAQACAQKKHFLCQKPLGLSLASAKEIAELAEQAGVKAAVNQQMRYSPSVNAAKDILRQGLLGDINYAAFNVNVNQPWETWTFWHEVEYFTMFGHTIHYFDTLRYLLGKTPEFIYTQVAHGTEREGVPGYLRDYSFLDFGGELKAQVDVNHDNKGAMEDWLAGFRIEGHQGVVNGTNGALHNYPHGQEDTLELYQVSDKKWQRPELEGRWFPHAFMGTMGQLMLAIESGSEPDNSVADGLDTIRMVLASIESIKHNRPVYINEFK